MVTFTRWSDLFGNQVSKLREVRTGFVTLLYDAEVERIPGMEDALWECWREGVAPRHAATRYVALIDWEVK